MVVIPAPDKSTRGQAPAGIRREVVVTASKVGIRGGVFATPSNAGICREVVAIPAKAGIRGGVVVIPAKAGIRGGVVVSPAKAGIHFVHKQFCVYILTNKPRGTLYVGVTSNLPQRVAQHREKLVDGFTGRYGLDRLAWFELHENAESAIAREKQLKKWNRLWKIELVEKANPDWQDLYDEIL